MVANTFNSGRQRQADSLFEARLGYRVQESSRETLSPKGGREGEGFPRNTHNFFYRLRKLQTTSPLAREPSRMSKCQSSRMQACSARSPTVLVPLQLLSLATTMRTAIFRNSFSFFYPKANSSNSFATLGHVARPPSRPPPPRHGQSMALGFANASASSEMTHSAPQSQTQTPRRRYRRPLSRVERSRCTVSLNHADIFLPAASRSAPPVFGHPC